MAKFIKCSCKSLEIESVTCNNKPVNIELVSSFEKSNALIISIGDYRPSIYFDGVDEEWTYPTEEERDKDYDEILNTFS